MKRKDKIVEFMKSDAYIPMKASELLMVLAVPKSDENEFYALLEQLVREGRVLLLKRARYKAAGDNVITGRISCSRNGFFAFCIASDGKGDVFIAGENLSDAVDGDFAAVMIDSKKNERGAREGHVINVLERANSRITGVISKKRGEVAFIKPDNSGFLVQITARGNVAAEKGDRVLLQILEYAENGDMSCRIIKNLGAADELESCIEAVICANEIKTEFDPEVLAEAEDVCGEAVEVGKRRDLRADMIFTIDGEDARDFDDAVSCIKLENGRYRIGVHIADVTHYVKENGAIDKEAFSRGTSVYLPNRVIPMLPESLSNGACSLRPNEDRYTLSVFMDVDNEGNILSHELCSSVIRSCARLTYKNAAALIAGEDEELLKSCRKIVPELKRMKRVAGYLYKKRLKRGSINFDFPEGKIIVDKDGYPCDIVKEEREITHKIIEEFMLAANETVAFIAEEAKIPFVFRVHGEPEKDKIESFAKFAANFGYSLKKDKKNGVTPKALQELLDKVKGKPEEAMISRAMLRSLMKAEYKPQCDGHFGLAADYYCHFTSPIRRYPDLMVHRLLKAYAEKKPLDGCETIVSEAAKSSSKAETGAELCERHVENIMKAYYMSNFVGESFSGRISGITRFGIFVELDNTAEGLLRIENIYDDFYIYDEERHMLVGEKRKHTKKIGDKISVMIAKCNIMSGEIDFLPANATLKEINMFYGNMRKKQDERQEPRRQRRKTEKGRRVWKKSK